MIAFVTFASKNWYHSMDRIRKEAIESNFFDEVLCYTEDDLSTYFNEYAKRNPRGYGYWGWKHFVARGAMHQLKMDSQDDYLVYADAGCTINPHGDMKRWIKLTGDSILSFQLGDQFTDRKYTKRELIKFMQADVYPKDILDTPQLMATTFVTNYEARGLLTWMDGLHSDLLDDYTENPHPEFIAHRHDQSAFSILRKINKCPIIPDETYHDGHGNYNPIAPIWATRRR